MTNGLKISQVESEAINIRERQLFCLSFSYIDGVWLLHFWYLQTIGHYFVCLSLIFMASDSTCDIFKPLVIILSVFLLYLWLLITTLLISSNLWPLFCLSFSYIYDFWLLHFWYLQTFGHYYQKWNKKP
jgi:hypothetical protein